VHCRRTDLNSSAENPIESDNLDVRDAEGRCYRVKDFAAQRNLEQTIRIETQGHDVVSAYANDNRAINSRPHGRRRRRAISEQLAFRYQRINERK